MPPFMDVQTLTPRPGRLKCVWVPGADGRLETVWVPDWELAEVAVAAEPTPAPAPLRKAG